MENTEIRYIKNGIRIRLRKGGRTTEEPLTFGINILSLSNQTIKKSTENQI